MRKKKVMDWIQKTNVASWDRENRTNDVSDPRVLKLDPVSHLPTQPYLKQEPVYATADDPDSASPAPESDSVRRQASDSMPNERVRTELRQRGATVSGAMQHYPATSHGRYPMPYQQNSGAHVGKEFHTSKGVQRSGSAGQAVRNPQGHATQRREFQSSTGQWHQGSRGGKTFQNSTGGRSFQGSVGPGNQGRGERDFYVSTGEGENGRKIQGSGAQPNPTPNYPTARFEKDYYVLDV
jgi:hypothetical protein